MSRRARLSVPITAALRCVLAIAALVSQLTLGALALPDRARADPLPDALTRLCGTGPALGTAAPRADRRAGRHRHDAACRPLSVALALPAVILPPEPGLPAPAVEPEAAGPTRPPARAPPASPAPTPPARAPPTLS